ncbi:phosphoenolpyruvate--protein phosphotransferase [Oligoflexus tunisiensis]|uniref:phosphoenolpyruvate--protein phosphotransferase n=1 Tax=Oligoflexus tunisiensis TaxID=708132 RepID=UPI001C407FDA|nr:phosphoenolpyruvate--protein phosphotransferase [Oligoflexus tunisiensis]
MSCQYRFAISLQQGLHARPAEAIRSTASLFSADIHLSNGRNGRRADAKSVLSILSADFRWLDECLLETSGADSQEALDALTKLVQEDLAAREEPLVETEPQGSSLRLPRSLRNLKPDFIAARPLAEGVAIGRAFFLRTPSFDDLASQEVFTSTRNEKERLDKAMECVKGKLLAHLELQENAEIFSIMKTHLSLLEDRDWLVHLRDAIASGYTASQAVMRIRDQYKELLQQSTTAYLRERWIDIHDIAEQVLENLLGRTIASKRPLPEGPFICLAESLNPSELLWLRSAPLQGLCLQECGPTSHVVVMARSLGIPLVVADLASGGIREGEEIIIEGRWGAIFHSLSPVIQRYMRREASLIRSQQTQELCSTARTHPQVPVMIRANIGFRDEAPAARIQGAQGVGLLRTELLFLNRDQAPDEEEQYRDYAAVAASFHPEPVTIRTLDVGGDKELSYLKIPPEANPFLGYRAVRLYDEYSTLIRHQIRAILRVSAQFHVRIMVPMISCLEEWLSFRARLESIMQELDQEGIAFDRSIRVGLMVEIPSIAFALDKVCVNCDFISLGTNDLLQYFLACDRQSEKLAYLYDDLHPSFLRLLRKVVQDAHARGVRVSLCGEMGQQVDKVPILLGLGVDEISLSSQKIPDIRMAVERQDPASCVQLVDRLLAQGTAHDVKTVLECFWEDQARDLTDVDLVILGADCENREEAIRELVHRLDRNGRTRDSIALEEDIWLREDVYATQLGYGFAVPHCKSRQVTANSIAFLRLKAPIAWGESSAGTVDCIVLIAMKEGATQQHMKVISNLARKVMREEFRHALRTENSPQAIHALLCQDLLAHESGVQ